MKYKYHPPLLIQKIFNSFIWETTNNKILLTFDDGPTEEATLKILNVLRSNNLKAAFFCVGNNIQKNTGLTENILEADHLIANHTMNHKSLTRMNRKESISEIETFNLLLKNKFNYDVRYFRPVYGRFNLKTKRILTDLNLKCIMWSLLTYDFENNIEKVEYSIKNYLKKNSVVVFHDSIKCINIIERSLNFTIEQASKMGFEFGEPEECLK